MKDYSKIIIYIIIIYLIYYLYSDTNTENFAGSKKWKKLSKIIGGRRKFLRNLKRWKKFRRNRLRRRIKNYLYSPRNYLYYPKRYYRYYNDYFDMDNYHNILTRSSWQVKTTVVVHENYNGWRSIYQYGNNKQQRGPALLIPPNFTKNWMLSFRMDTNLKYNDGIDIVVPKRYRRLGQPLTIKVRVNRVTGGYRFRNPDLTSSTLLRIWINNYEVAREWIDGTPIVYNGSMWIKGPWYSNYGFEVSNTTISV